MQQDRLHMVYWMRSEAVMKVRMSNERDKTNCCSYYENIIVKLYIFGGFIIGINTLVLKNTVQENTSALFNITSFHISKKTKI